MVTEPTFPGCLIEVRPVGLFLMEDEKGVDEKVLVVPMRDPSMPSTASSPTAPRTS